MRRPSCGTPHRKWCSSYHAGLMSDYYAARDAVLALRESGTVVSTSYSAGSDGATVTAGALEDDEFRAAFPLPRLRDWMVDYAARWRDPEQ